jgi:hypothetical protein
VVAAEVTLGSSRATASASTAGIELLISLLVGLAIIGELILFIIPGIYISIRLAVRIQALVVEYLSGT